MSDSAPIQEAVEQAPPSDEPVESQEQPEPQQAQATDDEPITDDPAINAAIAATSIKIPDGEELVPKSQLVNVAISYRNKLKAARQAAPDPAVAQELDQARARLREAEPLAQAFRAIQSAQPQQQAQQQAEPTEDMGELEEVAKLFDFYKADGTPDLERARKANEITDRRATKKAQAQTAPLVQHTLTGQAHHNVARAKATMHPIDKRTADPAILDRLVAQIAKQPNGLATLADADSVKQIWLNAYALTTFQAQQAAAPQQQQQDDPPPTQQRSAPVFTERAGGQAPQQQKTLSTSEKKAAKEAGLTEKQYLDVAKNMPW